MRKPPAACTPYKKPLPALKIIIVLVIFSLPLNTCGPNTLPATPASPAILATPILISPTPDLTLTRQALTPIPTDTPSEPSATPTSTNPPPAIPTTAPPVEDSTPTIGPCGFIWATKSLLELSEQLLVKLKDANLPVQAASAEAYGEDCRYADGSIAYFAAMETDYRITLTVTDLNDAAQLGELLAKTLDVIDQFPVGETPGPNPGYIGITFQAGDQVENLWFQRSQANDLRTQGLTGKDLYEALIAK